jgi:hypothetical protein
LRAEGFFCNLDVRRDFLLLIWAMGIRNTYLSKITKVSCMFRHGVRPLVDRRGVPDQQRAGLSLL